MTLPPGFTDRPARQSYDVVLIGGAMMGSSTAFWLTEMAEFTGSVLVIERDPSYAWCSTAHTNSCVRQQFSSELNIRISQFTADFVAGFRGYMGGDPRVPEIAIRSHGYLYLAGTAAGAEGLRAAAAVQRALGAETELLTPGEIAARYPYYDLDGIVLGSINRKDEGYFDGAVIFDWFRRLARERGVEYLSGEVTGITRNAAGDRALGVTLASGETIACGQVVNAAGPRAARVAAMIGAALPVEPRKRFSWIFRAERPVPGHLPLTIDPSGVHVRENLGGTYLAGCPADPDPAVDPGDFAMDPARWEEHAWPAIAARIPQFEAVRLQAEWVGHYAFNTFDHNAITGPHPEVSNFLFLNGFSGHGLQQSPAMGRGTAEWLATGGYRTLDLSPFHYGRIAAGEPYREIAVI